MALLCETFPGISRNGPQKPVENLTVVMKYHGLTRSNERDYKHVTFSAEYSHMLLWQKEPLVSVFSGELFHSKVKTKHSVLESVH